jgi:hypothetical protein
MGWRSLPFEYRFGISFSAGREATIKPPKSDELPESAIGYAVNLTDFECAMRAA